jgi:hypothetical protein
LQAVPEAKHICRLSKKHHPAPHSNPPCRQTTRSATSLSAHWHKKSKLTKKRITDVSSYVIFYEEMNCAILRHIKKFKTSLTTISELHSNKKQSGQNNF